ncbi:hypothetical protein B484DRAFT_258238 [Ochromonadaceae sp. CCMP2298]|nr:hypothetical protein B484DRAFT_258238 [Ochromonadaceae sp. CCMP2298]
MYNFGSPRVGNRNFALFYDKIVPNSYRVVVDGDIVAALPPPPRYSHVGTEILIDHLGAGSIIIDPSFVERWLRTHMKSSVAVHSLLVYRKGLLGIKLAAEFMRDHANDASAPVDPLRLALKVRTHSQVNSIIDENAGIAADLVDADAEEEEGQGGDRGDRGSVSDMYGGGFKNSNDMELCPPYTPSSPQNPLQNPQNPLWASDPSYPSYPSLSLPDPSLPDPSDDRFSHASVSSVGSVGSAGGADLAAHYAHDVEHMAYMQQMTAKHTEGWLKSASMQASASASGALGALGAIQAASPVRAILRRASRRGERSERSEGSESPLPSVPNITEAANSDSV